MRPKDLVLLFSREYEAAYGHKYPVAWGKHCRVAKRLLGLVPEAQLGALVKWYLNEFKDRFHIQKGRPLEFLPLALPSFLAYLKEEEKIGEIRGENYGRLEQAAKELAHSNGVGELREIQEEEAQWDEDPDPSA